MRDYDEVLTWEDLTNSERELAKYLNSLESSDVVDYLLREAIFEDFRDQGLIDDFLKFVKKYQVTDPQDVLKWYCACVKSDEYEEDDDYEYNSNDEPDRSFHYYTFLRD